MLLVSAITFYTLSLWSPKKNEDKPSVELNKNETLRDYYIAGCGVGNKLTIFPTPKEEGDNKDFYEFIGHLKKITAACDAAANLETYESKLKNSIKNGDPKQIFDDYMDEMNSLSDAIQRQSSKNQSQIFCLGRYIHELPTLLFFNAKKEQLLPIIVSLKSLASEADLPDVIKEEITKYIAMVESDNEEVSAIMDTANFVSQSIQLVIK